MKHPVWYLLGCTLMLVQLSSAQWYQQNSGTGQDLNAAYFTEATRGWVVGDGGIVLHTSDGGTTWTPQLSGTSLPLFDVSFADSLFGTAVGMGGTIIHTTDGGLHWTPQSSGTEWHLWSLFSFDSDTIWAVGGASLWGYWLDNVGVILKTTNGGMRWDVLYSDSSHCCDSAHALFSVFFIDAQRGWVGGDNVALRTTDGGSTWEKETPLFGGTFFSIHFSDINNGWMVGSHRSGEMDAHGDMVRTTNGGMTWIDYGQEALNVEFWEQLVWVRSYDAYNTIVVGRMGEMTVYRTRDAGSTWVSNPSGWDPDHLNLTGLYGRPFFIDSLVGWLPAERGTILHTTNGGVTSTEGDGRDDVPTDFSLSQNYPNPFNPSSTITYTLPRSAQVRLSVYNTLGEEVTVLVSEQLPAGTHQTEWTASNQPSGVYFYRLQAEDFAQTRKLVLLK